MVIEQLTIFDECEEEDERKIKLVRCVMSDDWSHKTNKKGIICFDKVEFSKLELLNLISVATSIKTIAIDFDGTVTNKDNYPDLGAPTTHARFSINQLIE